MADEFSMQTPPPSGRGYEPVRRRTGRVVLGTALIAFVLGAGAMAYAAWEGLLPYQAPRARPAAMAERPAPAISPVPTVRDGAALGAVQDELEARVSALGQRLDTLDLQASAASGNAARAEALLIAFAARRALDRGAPLGFIEDQLRLRFGDAQPNAVATVIEAARRPVTLDQLLAGLDSLAPSLTQAPTTGNAWDRIRREVASLFVIRHESAPSPQPVTTLQRARLMLTAGRTGEAIAEVQRLPGAAGASDWIVAARRFDRAHQALDLLETTAMLDTRGLNDGKGGRVDTPTPIAPATLPIAAEPAPAA